MNKLINTYFPVLDNGFICLKNFMGGDSSVVQAARVSYGKGTKTVSEDETLIRYLMRQKHTTPFEMTEFQFHIRIPMDSWRQMIRHRTANVSEYSTRYSEAIDEKQITPNNKWRTQSKNNKQGSGDYIDSITGAALSIQEKDLHDHANEVYKSRLDAGVAREQARKDLPLSTYTEAYWKIDLHNLFHFLKLRCDEHAQWEIRQYANILAGIVKETCPFSYNAWYDYIMCGVNFSRKELEFLIEKLQEKSQTPYSIYDNSLGLTKREQEEFKQKISSVKSYNFDLPWSEAYTYDEHGTKQQFK